LEVLRQLNQLVLVLEHPLPKLSALVLSQWASQPHKPVLVYPLLRCLLKIKEDKCSEDLLVLLVCLVEVP
jgi:hypothetical protein